MFNNVHLLSTYHCHVPTKKTSSVKENLCLDIDSRSAGILLGKKELFDNEESQG